MLLHFKTHMWAENCSIWNRNRAVIKWVSINDYLAPFALNSSWFSSSGSPLIRSHFSWIRFAFGVTSSLADEYDLSVCLCPSVTLTSTCNLWQWWNEAAIIWLINTDFPTNGIYLHTRPCFWDCGFIDGIKTVPWWQETSGTAMRKLSFFFSFFLFFSFIFFLIESCIFLCVFHS